jgi:arsenate reductase
MLTIYHNPRCKKSRAGLAFLEEHGLEHEVRSYLNDLLSEEEIRNLLKKLNMEPDQLVRTQEDQYKKELKGRKFTKDEWIRILKENPKLIKRPIVEGKYKAVIGDPVENIQPFV